MIGLGIYDNREQIEDLIKEIDDDGEISFEEFCDIVKNSEKNEQTQVLNQFFKDLSSGSIGDKNLNFVLIYSAIRRNHMLNRFIGNGEEKVQGSRILENISVQYFEAEERK